MKISYRTANLYTDRTSIINLLEENIGDKSKDRYDWMYVNNKMGEPHVILAVDEESQDNIGMVSLFPMLFNGIENVWLAGDYFVMKKYRSLFVAIGLQKNLIEHIDTIKGTVITFPNSNSEPIIKRLGYEVVYECDRFVKVLNFTKLIESKTNKTLSSIISPFINAYFKMTSCEYLTGYINKYVVTNIDDFYSNSTVLERHENIKHNRVKKLDLLNWKYIDNPFMQYNVYPISKNGNIAGCIVYYLKDNDAVIREVLSSVNHNEYLFKYFINEMRKNKIEKIVYNSNRFDSNLEILEKCNFALRMSIGKYYIYSSALNAEFVKNSIAISASDDDM